MMAERTPTGPTIEHSEYLGGSDIAAVLGAHPYKSQLDVWAEKKGYESEGGVAARVGQVLERPLLESDLYRPGERLVYPGTLLKRDEPWMGATPDAIARDGGDVVDVQCKIVGSRQRFRWGSEWEGADGVPEEVYAQVQWEMACVGDGCAIAEVPCLQMPDLPIYRIERDDEFLADAMDVAYAWWRRHVVAGTMPDVRAGDRKTLLRIHPRVERELQPMPLPARAALEAWWRADEQLRWAEATKEDAEDHLIAMITNAEGFEDSRFTVTYREESGQVSYRSLADSLRVPKEEREKHRGAPTRRLRITRNREEKNR